MQFAGDELAARIRERGLRVTPQRLAVHEALRRLGRHVTAEELLREVSAGSPGIALPTVYAILDLLVELGAVRRLASAAGTAVYDPVQDGHHHLTCSVCGKVEDLPAGVDVSPALLAAAAAGFVATGAEVIVQGRCSACAGRDRRSRC